MILFDISPISGGAGIGIGLAVIFFLICAAAAFIAFKMLKRTVKMAIRMAIVSIILLVAIIGGVSLLYFGSSSGGSKTPVQQKR
jgi:hypothetical protein